MSDFNLTNEEIVYLFKHFDTYKAMLEKEVTRHYAVMQGHLRIYKEVYGRTEDFDEDAYNLYDQFLNVEMPRSIAEKSAIIDSIREKLVPVYDMIIESDDSIEDRVTNKYIKESEETRRLLEEIKNKTNGDKNLF